MSRPRNAIVYNAATYRPLISPILESNLSACVRLLRQRHESVMKSAGTGPLAQGLADNLLSLRLAEARLEKIEFNRRLPAHPMQIAVIGPTQSGKSTLVNVLLGESRARVSPLAGYTVHPQGFPLNVQFSSLGWLEEYFSGYRRLKPEDLPEAGLESFALAEPTLRAGGSLPAAVVWDTPDFDSVDSADYRNAVLRTAALADLLLLVVSKDKYADQSVWEVMSLFEPLGQPTVACLNKLTPGARETLVRSFEEKWRAARRDPPPPVAVLPWIQGTEGAVPENPANELASLLAQTCGKVDRGSSEEGISRFLRTHWQDWLAPIRREMAAQSEWTGLVDSALKEGLSIYRRDFLDHPQSYETFQRALAELLTLLEIPGLAGGLAAARKILTWPARQLARLGKGSRGKENLGQETAVLARIIEHLFIHLMQELLQKGAEDPTLSSYWRELAAALKAERKIGELQRASALATHVREFQGEIDRTAHQLHDHLREHPAVLNGLRATRVTADAAALAVALHTGGIGVQDFIIAPAILSVTSMLAESALGRYLFKAEAELKERQYQAVETLFDQTLRPVLVSLPNRLNSEDRFNIPEGMLEEAEKLIGLD